MTNEEYNKWLILYFDMQSINLQFNCNDIASSLKAQRDKIKQFCIDCLTGETFAVVPRGEFRLQVYMTISNGTNGAEGCIINPMEDVLNVLKDLRKMQKE